MAKKFAAAVAGMAFVIAASNAWALTFGTFVTSTDLSLALSNTQTIGFAYAGNKFVGSVYFGTNNNQLYQTDLNGGSVAMFGSPIAGASGEIYVSSSLGLGGFVAREVFAGPENQSVVYKFNNDGTGQTPFITGGATIGGGVRSIAFDPYGSYGFDMIVATNTGNVYRVNAAGIATLLASTGEDTEGLSFAPQALGPNVPSGTLVVASEGTGNLRAISPTGTVTVIANVGSAEMVSFVPLNLGISGNPLEGFYAANYNLDVIKAPASDFSPYLGDIIVTGETTHQVTDLHWNGSQFVSTFLGSFPNQPEDGIFVTAAILNPGCNQTNTCGSTSVPEPGTLLLLAAGFAGLSFSRYKRAN